MISLEVDLSYLEIHHNICY